MGRKYKNITVADVLEGYERGERFWHDFRIKNADFRGRDLAGATFVYASLPGAMFDDADMTGMSLADSTLTDASLADAALHEATITGTSLRRASLAGATLSSADLQAVVVMEADLSSCSLDGTYFKDCDLGGARFDGARLGSTTFANVDLSALCDATRLFQWSPSYVDFRSVMRSYRHPGLKRFLVDCGVPPLVAQFTIDAAEAEGEDVLNSLMRSTFISYGAPDEEFARKLYEELRAHGVTTFFFPESARLGRRIGDEVHSRIQEHDRVILVCSEESLDRPGVRNEIQETFDREARDGGATYLIPITIDDYVFTGWDDPLAERVRGRVVGDFHGGRTDPQVFDRAMSRLLAALRKEPT